MRISLVAALGATALVVAAVAAALGACGSDDGGSDMPADLDASMGSDTTLATDGKAPPVPSEFGLDKRPANPTCKAPARPPSNAKVKFDRVFASTTLDHPMMIAQIPSDPSRWFVAQRGGPNPANGLGNGGSAKIVSFAIGNPTALTTVATITPLSGIFGEGGLLGMAFHPKFAQNGRLYITWTTIGAIGPNFMRSAVGYLTSTDNGVSFGNYTELFTFDQTDAMFQNHKGGGIAFGKDGYLYLSFGDGGNSDDFYHNGQNVNGMFAKLLRIDVDNPSGGKPYGIPADNPFASGGGEPAIFARGFRNPFRFSIDRETNEVWVGDVGQNAYEEIDAKVKLGGNYGWPCREGKHDSIAPIDPANAIDPAKCPNYVDGVGTPGLVDPLVEFEHVPANTRAITGGIVYRGKAIPELTGTYVFGDYVKQQLSTMTLDPGTGEPIVTDLDAVAAPSATWVSFAEDDNGEIYAVALNEGQIWRLNRAAPAMPNTFPDRLSKTGCTDPTDVKKPASGLVPYGVNVALWSDGALKDRWVALPDGKNITVSAVDGDFDFPNGTVLMKTFSIGGKRIETRLFMRHDDGGWNGYTYEWLDDQSDAMLLPAGKTKKVGAQTWTYPSRSECVSCHSDAAGRSLGLELGQLNGDYVYPTTNRVANQLKTFDHIGMFSAPLGKPVDQLVKFPDVFGTAAVDQRARAYLHENCSMCHRPKGPGLGNMDLRFGTAFADTKTCNVVPQQGDVGAAGAKLLVPGMPALSVLSLRPHSPAQNRMPPLASTVVDDKGVKVLDDFIKSVAACP